MECEKKSNEDFIEMLVGQISKTNITEEEKKLYTKKILKYLKLKIDYYKTTGIDISLATMFIGMGLGTSIMDNSDSYIPFILYGLGGTTLLVTSVKRKIKYKDNFNNFIKKEVGFLKEKTE